MIRNALNGYNNPQEVGLAAVNRRGGTIAIRVLGSPLRGSDNATVGMILLMEQDANRHDALVEPAQLGGTAATPD